MTRYYSSMHSAEHFSFGAIAIHGSASMHYHFLRSAYVTHNFELGFFSHHSLKSTPVFLRARYRTVTIGPIIKRLAAVYTHATLCKWHKFLKEQTFETDAR